MPKKGDDQGGHRHRGQGGRGQQRPPTTVGQRRRRPEGAQSAGENGIAGQTPGQGDREPACFRHRPQPSAVS